MALSGNSMFHRRCRVVVAAGSLCVSLAAFGEVRPDAVPDSPRIMGLIPNYQTVNGGGASVPKLTGKQKWALFARSTYDPFNIADVALGATFSHLRGGTPDYGVDRDAFADRVGAAFADFTAQNALTGAVMPQLFHQDPRYFRMGPGHPLWIRIGYSLSRVAITRSDEGRNQFNWSFLVGSVAAVGLSNAYYPAGSRNLGVMESRMVGITLGSATGNLLPEFWPDIQRRWAPKLQVIQHLLPHMRRGRGSHSTSLPLFQPASSGAQ